MRKESNLTEDEIECIEKLEKENFEINNWANYIRLMMSKTRLEFILGLISIRKLTCIEETLNVIDKNGLMNIEILMFLFEKLRSMENYIKVNK